MAKREHSPSPVDQSEPGKLDTKDQDKSFESRDNKKSGKGKQDSGSGKKGGFDFGENGQHWESYKEKQKTEKNLSEVKKYESKQQVREAKIKDLKGEIEFTKKEKELQAELKALQTSELLQKAVEAEKNGTGKTEVNKEAVVKEAEGIVEETAKEQAKEVDKALAAGSITTAQAEQVRSVLFAEDGKKGFFSRMKERVGNWSATHPRLSSFLVGMGTGAAVRTAVKAGYVAAFGANLPWLVAAGATAGGLLEGGKAVWRESKAYQPKEILTKFRQADYLEKAAMLNKLEDLYKHQRFSASPEEYQEIERTLGSARLEMQTELDKKDGKFANYSEKDKIEYLLNSSRGIKNGFEKSDRGKEVRILMRRIDKNLDAKRDFGNVLRNKKAIVGRAILKGAAYGGLGATVGAAALEGIDWLRGGGGVVREVVTTTELRGNLSDHFTKVLDRRGLTGGARDAIHDLIEQHKGIDPNFANGVSVEQLVYAEDTIVKDAIKHGIDINSREFTVSSADILDALTRAGVVGSKPTLTEAGIANIGELIQTKAHFLSAATKAKMMDFDPVAMQEFITETVTESTEASGVELSADDYAALAAVAAGIIAAETLDARANREANPRAERIFNYTETTETPPSDGSGDVQAGVVVNAAPGAPKSSVGSGTTPPPADFDWGKALGPESNNPGPEGTVAAGSGEKAKEIAHDGSLEGRLNAQLEAAGLNAELVIPEQVGGKKNAEKIERLLAQFIKSAKQLNNLNISNRIILNISSKGERTLDSKNDVVVAGIPLSSKIEAGDMTSLVDRMIEAEVSKKFVELESGYEFKVKVPEQEAFNLLSAADQYRAINRLNQALQDLDPNEFKKLTKGLKTINITDYEFIDRDEVNIPLFQLKSQGWAYNGLKPAVIIGMLRESYQDRMALGPMNREQEFEKYSGIKKLQSYEQLPEQNRIQAEEYLLDIINNEFKDGLPNDVKIALNNRYGIKPGILSLDMSKPDEEYIRRQLHQGLRRADPERLKRVPALVRERLERSGKNSDKKEVWPKVKEKKELIIPPIKARVENQAPDLAPIEDNEIIKNNGLDEVWVANARARAKGTITEAQRNKIEAYLKENNVKVETLLAMKAKDLPKITSVMPGKLKLYVRQETLNDIASLINGSEEDVQRAHDLRDKYIDFIS